MPTDLKALAISAKKMNEEKGLTADELIQQIMKSMNEIPNNLQAFVDSVVMTQNVLPMPLLGWKAFLEDLEYTNEKHGLNLIIKSELLPGDYAYDNASQEEK